MINTNPMAPEWKKTLGEMGMTKDVKHPNLDLEPLKSKLLSIGGEAVVIHREPEVDKILSRGRLFLGEGAPIRKGNNCRCHENAAKNFVQLGYGIATGYALSVDGAWRQHSWNLDDEKGTPIETTEPRVAYFGFILNEDESKQFAEENPETEMVRSVLDDDYVTRSFIVIWRPDQLEVDVQDEKEVTIRSRIEMDREVLGHAVWIVKNDPDTDEFVLYGSLSVEEIAYDLEEGEFQTILFSPEYNPFSTPVPIKDPETVQFLKAANARVDEVLFEIDDEGPEVAHLRSLSWALYEALDTAL